MHCSCVRQTSLPNISPIAAAVLYKPDQVAPFYKYPYRDLASFRAAAAEVDLPSAKRENLIQALRQCNPPSAALDKLAQPGVVAVVTGQQAGLFSGPAYTIYKALHAAKLAQWLTENGVPAVPVFWLATEDHDFAEVNHVWVFNSEHRPAKVEVRRPASGQPVGDVTLPAPPLAELRAAMSGLPFLDEVISVVEESYRSGITMGAAFASLLRQILQRFDIIQVDPLIPAFRKLAAPTLAAAVDAAHDLSENVLRRGKELAEAGFHSQVHVEQQTSFVFLLENGKRLPLRRHGDEYALNGRKLEKRELIERADSLSPNALLRPVVQDSMLPTVAYIGGPAEIAYLAQSQVIYDTLLRRMPVAVPRAGFTILDAHSEKLLGHYRLGLEDFFHGEEALRQRLSAALVPPSLKGSVGQAAGTIDSVIANLRQEILSFDPTLAAALDRSGRKIQYQIGKIQTKIEREAFVRDSRAARDASSLYGLIYPERHLQERLYSILPFLARHGMEITSVLNDALQLDCPDHRILVA